MRSWKNWEVRVESTLYLETTQRGVSRIEEDAASKVKGWIRGHMKICPFLEVAVSHHQGRYGHEIMVNSSCGDGTCSWVMVVNGINEYVTEMTEEIQENHVDDIGYHQREWIDVEPGQYDKSCFEVP